VTQGYLLGELVRRITGTSFAQFLKSEVTDVLDVDFHVGLPESEEPRVSFVIPGDGNVVEGLDPESIAYRSWMSPPIDFTWPRYRGGVQRRFPHRTARQRTFGGVDPVNRRQQRRVQRYEILFREDRRADLRDSGTRRGPGTGRRDELRMGYGLASSVTPLGPRGCFWAGLVHSCSWIKTSASRLPIRRTKCSSCRKHSRCQHCARRRRGRSSLGVPGGSHPELSVFHRRRLARRYPKRRHGRNALL